MWEKILDICLNYGFIGVIAFFYLRNYQKREEQNSKNFQLFIDNILKSNSKNVQDLKTSIDKLIETLDNNDKFYNKALEDIIKEISDLREKYISVTNQLSAVIVDDRLLSGLSFYNIAGYIIKVCTYKALIDIIVEIDKNGYDNQKQIELLKSTIVRIVDRRRTEGKNDISILNYDDAKKDSFCEIGETIYQKYMQELNDEIINDINLEDLLEDKNYARLKAIIRNKLFAYLDEIISLLKEITRK